MIPTLLALAAQEPEGKGIGDHIMEHVADDHWVFRHFGFGQAHFEPTKHWLYFVVASLVVLGLVRWALGNYAKKGVPHGPAAAVEAMVLFIRDEIAEPNIPHEGERYTPLLCSFFFFILIAALLGLVPFVKTTRGCRRDPPPPRARR